MIGPFAQQHIDSLHTEIAEVERLIGIQDDLTIAGLCKGIDTTEAENKSLQMRGLLAGMRTHSRKKAITEAKCNRRERSEAVLALSTSMRK
jgi:hypothetical protein